MGQIDLYRPWQPMVNTLEKLTNMKEHPKDILAKP